MPRLTLIEGGRVALENALVKELFRPTAEASPLEASLLKTLARRGSLFAVAPSSPDIDATAQPTPSVKSP